MSATATAPAKGADALIREARKSKTHDGALAKIAAAREAHVATAAALKQATHEVLADANGDGVSWVTIGEALGVSAQRAQQLARPPAGE